MFTPTYTAKAKASLQSPSIETPTLLSQETVEQEANRPWDTEGGPCAQTLNDHTVDDIAHIKYPDARTSSKVKVKKARDDCCVYYPANPTIPYPPR